MPNPLDRFVGKRGSVDVKVRPIPKLAEFYHNYGVKLAAQKFDEAMETWRQDLQRILPTNEAIESTITTIIQTVVNVSGGSSGGGGSTTTPPPAIPPFDPAPLIALITQLSNDLSAHIAQVIVHGTTSPVVGETDEQVLERKTIGFADPRNAKFKHALQVSGIVTGEVFTVPAEYNMTVSGPFTVEVGGELIVEGAVGFV